MTEPQTWHLNLTVSLKPVKVDRRRREHKGRDIAPYRDEPKPPTGKISFAGADPLENEDW